MIWCGFRFFKVFFKRKSRILWFISQINFSRIFRTFFKNFVIGACWVSKVINIGSENSILDSILHFPLSLYHSSPFSRIFPLLKAIEAFRLYFSMILAYRAELWSSFESNNKMWGKNIFPAFFSHFFQKFVIGPYVSHQLFCKKTELIKIISWKYFFFRIKC